MRRLLPVLLLALCTVPAHGQSLSDRFNQLFTFGDCGRPLCLDVNATVHGEHYNPSIVQGEDDLLAFITNSIGLTVSQIPFAAATGGVTYSFESGVPVASSVSAGPIFADRAETLGRGQLLFGANVTGASFSQIRGVSLDDLLLRFTHEDVDPSPSLGDPVFERDYIEVTTNLDLSLLVTSIFAAYGVSDRVDIGIALPIVRSSMTGRSQAIIQQYSATTPHSFGTPSNPMQTAQASTEGSATGLGDIAARVKAHVYQGPTVGLALIGDLRLATGRSEDFLGSGATSIRIFGAASARYEAFSPHVNAGFQYTSADWATTRVLGTAGFDYLLGEQVTLAAELMTNLEVGESKLTLPEPVVFTTPDVVQLPLTDIPDRNDNFVDAAIGAKIQAGTQLRLVTNIVVPLAKAGLRPGVTWTVGFEVSR
jgi:hypothetical protein